MKFKLGDCVYKTKGSEWIGRVVGTYSTDLTPEGYCVESIYHSGSVQIYPASALELLKDVPHLLSLSDVDLRMFIATLRMRQAQLLIDIEKTDAPKEPFENEYKQLQIRIDNYERALSSRPSM